MSKEANWRQTLAERNKQALSSWKYADEDGGSKWLLRRCRAVLKQISGPNVSDAAWRRCVVALALLRLEEALDPGFDLLLMTFVEHLTLELATDTHALLVESLTFLPAKRSAPIWSAFLDNLLDNMVNTWSWTNWSDAQRAMLQDTPGASDALERLVTPRLSRPMAASGAYLNDIPEFAWVSMAMEIHEVPPRWVAPCLAKVIKFWGKVPVWQRQNPQVHALFGWLPQDELLALLTSPQRVKPWELFHLCPHKDVRALALQEVLGGNEYAWRVQELEAMLMAQGAAMVPLLRKALAAGIQKPGPRWSCIRTVARLTAPGEAQSLGVWLGSEDRWMRAAAFEGLCAMPDVNAVSRAVEPLLQTEGEGQRLARWLVDLKSGQRQEREPHEVFDWIAQERQARLAFERTYRPVAKDFVAPTAFGPMFAMMGVEFLLRLCIDTSIGQRDLSSYRGLFWQVREVCRHDERLLGVMIVYNDLAQSERMIEGEDFGQTLTDLVKTFGVERVAHYVRYALEHVKPRRRPDFYQWYSQHVPTDESFHLEQLRDTSEQVQILAAAALFKASPQGFESVLGLLKSKKGHERRGAALALGAMGRPDARQAIEAALSKERSKKNKPFLEAARTACDPILSALSTNEVSFGAYDPADGFTATSGLSQLRGLLYESPPDLNWSRLCDLLQRFVHIDALEMALDYLTPEQLARWNVKGRQMPWGWQEIDGLATLGMPAPDSEAFACKVAPVSLVMDGRAEVWMDGRLKALDQSVRTRRFVPEDVALFVHWVAKAWAWCESWGIGLDLLEVRVDGGSVHAGRMTHAESTAMVLVGGFGVELVRENARREDKGLPHGLRMIRVKVPARHPVRQETGIGPRKRYLDLIPLIGADQVQGRVANQEDA